MCKVVFLEIIGVLLYAKAFASIKNFDKKYINLKTENFCLQPTFRLASVSFVSMYVCDFFFCEIDLSTNSPSHLHWRCALGCVSETNREKERGGGGGEKVVCAQ